MAEYVKIAAVQDVPPGTMKTVIQGGLRIALANMDGEIFAIDDTCTHQQCSLGSEGFLDGGVVTCGCHGAQFDVTNGQVLALPATQSVRSYRTKVEGNDIFIEL